VEISPAYPFFFKHKIKQRRTSWSKQSQSARIAATNDNSKTARDTPACSSFPVGAIAPVAEGRIGLLEYKRYYYFHSGVCVSEGRQRSRNKWIAALAVGLVIGLGLGILTSMLVILPNFHQERVFAINPVQVSGTVSVAAKGTIQFINDNESISTRYDHRVQLSEGNYTIVLSGGYSYEVYLGTGQTGYSYKWSLYVPSNITSLIENFPN
jgi:hypothetical protein